MIQRSRKSLTSEKGRILPRLGKNIYQKKLIDGEKEMTFEPNIEKTTLPDKQQGTICTSNPLKAPTCK